MADHDLRPETLAAHALGGIDGATGAIIPPIHPSTTYERDADLGYGRGRCYSRADNPTYDAAADTLTALEGGAQTLLFASGMAAATAVFQALEPGDHVVVSKVMYWALRAWLRGFATRWGLEVEAVDTSCLDAVRSALRPGRTRLVWVESPANPLWVISDIAALAELAHGAGAKLAVDSTIASPVLTRPLALGADIVLHSASKYLNGLPTWSRGRWSPAATTRSGSKSRSIGRRWAASSVPSRPGCCCAACGRCSPGSRWPAAWPRHSPNA